jgi:uncharacterized membrane protein
MNGATNTAEKFNELRGVTTPTRAFRMRLWLANSLWVSVLGGNLIVVLIAFILPRLDEHFDLANSFPLTAGTTQAIFGALAGSMITFTGIVFSAIFIAAQIQTSAYSPRLAAQLRQDPVIMGALVLSTATAAYSMFALAAIDRLDIENAEKVPALTVLFGMLLALATLAQFAALVQRAFESIQIGGILRTLGRKGWRVINDVHPPLAPGTSLPRAAMPTDVSIAEIEFSGPPGVVAAIDRRAVIQLADATGAFVEVLPQVGQFVSGRTGAVRLHGESNDATAKQVQRVFVLARQRTTDQDPSFVLRIMVDIAIRALSAAINDPTTAVQVIDRIEAALIMLYERQPGPAFIADSNGRARGLVHAPTWVEYFDLGVTEIRIYGGQSLQVHRRTRAMLEHIATVVRDEDLPRVELELKLLDQQLKSSIISDHDVSMARESDRLGIGSV